MCSMWNFDPTVAHVPFPNHDPRNSEIFAISTTDRIFVFNAVTGTQKNSCIPFRIGLWVSSKNYRTPFSPASKSFSISRQNDFIADCSKVAFSHKGHWDQTIFLICQWHSGQRVLPL
mmetsp:Transcript_27105/g.71473  ORF Transcript_27105/g.71473 Transcript_27105/m.71473 type:complete len:117 (+) Transcript_27105:493-843(+)